MENQKLENTNHPAKFGFASIKGEKKAYKIEMNLPFTCLNILFPNTQTYSLNLMLNTSEEF